MGNDREQVDIAIVGAGPAGLQAARLLHDAGRKVAVIDKGRGPGGRLSTRRGTGSVRLDHGCQFLSFPAGTDPSVQQAWHDAQVAVPWRPKLAPDSGHPHLVDDEWLIGSPTMSAIPKYLARDLDVRCSQRVMSLACHDSTWTLCDGDGAALLHAPQVLLAIPSPQALDLLSPVNFAGVDLLDSVVYQANWTLVVEGERVPSSTFQASAPPEGPLGWVANQASKPGREGVNAWVAQASDAWSTDHLEDDADDVRRELLAALADLLGQPLGDRGTVHRWRHGIVHRAAGRAVVVDDLQGLAACGDWCLGPTVGHAILSGRAAADHFL